MPKKRSNPEYVLQCQVAYYLALKYPSVKFTISPQGMKLPIGVAMKLKRMGYHPGTPDLMIFKPNVYRHKVVTKNLRTGLDTELSLETPLDYALFIELKTKEDKPMGIRKGVVKPEQQEWIDYLNNNGYKAAVCYGYDEAIKTIEEYMK